MLWPHCLISWHRLTNCDMTITTGFKVPSYPYFSSQMLPVEMPPLEPQANNKNSSSNSNSNNNASALNAPTAIQPAPAPTSTPTQTPAPASATPAPSSAATSGSQKTTTPGRSPTSQTGGSKRKQDPSALDDSAREAQDEDKRRRNTAASARFRIKKKEREKNLERTVEEVTTKNNSLESRVAQLEMENRWLRNLITEKNDSTISDGDLSGMFNKFRESDGARKVGEEGSS